MKKRHVLLLILTFVLSFSVFAACEFGSGGNQPKQYKIIFDAQGGSGVNDMIVDEDESIATEPKSVYENHIFKGWALSKGGNTVSFPFKPNGDITLYAIWSDTVSVTFESCGGTIFEVNEIEKGAYLNEFDFLPSRDGHVFDGWYTGEAVKKYGAKYSFDKKIEADLTLYAKWNLPFLKFTYNYFSDHELDYLTVSGSDSSATDIVIPAEFDELPVKTIGEKAFSGFSALKSVVITQGITFISSEAFAGCTQLEGITIPQSIESIGARAFSGCTSFTEFTRPATVKTVNSSVLEGCDNIEKLIIEEAGAGGIYGGNYVTGFFGTPTPVGLRTVEILTGTELRNNAFKDSALLTTVILPETMTMLNNGAFVGCSALETVNLPDSLTWFASYETYFSGCDSLVLETVDEHLYYIDNWLVKIDTDAEIINPEFKDTTVGISSYLFRDVTTLNALIFPDTLKFIGSSTFDGCTSLISISFGMGDLSIGAGAFSGCSNITKFYPLFIPKNVVSINGFAFRIMSNVYCEAPERPEGWHMNWNSATSDAGNNEIWDVVSYGELNDEYKYVEQSATLIITEYTGSATEVEIPQTLLGKQVSFGNAIFQGNKTITRIVLPEGIKKIPNNFFNGCTALVSVNIPSTVIEIGSNAFYNCKDLQSIILPQGLEKIGASAFNSNYALKLEYLYLPSSVTTVGSSIIWSSDVYCEVAEKPDGWSNDWMIGTSKKVYWDVVGIFSNSEYKYVEYGTTTEILNYLGAAETLAIDEIADKPVTQIKAEAFRDNTTLKTVILPDGLTVLNQSLFNNCTALQSVTLPIGLKEIAPYAFYNCKKLSQVNLVSGLEKIGGSAFAKTELTSITIPDSVISIGSYAFDGCSELESATLPSGLTEIPASLFAGCSKLGSIIIPENVETIGTAAFYRCFDLTEVTIPASVSEIRATAFLGCELRDFFIPATVLTMGEQAVTYDVYCEASSKPANWNSAWFNASYGATAPIYTAHWDVVGISTDSDYKYVEYSDKTTIMEYLGSAQNLVIDKINGKSVTAIGRNAFSGNKNLVTVTLPESLVYIGGAAFRYCSNLETINLPSSVTTLSEFVFEHCSLLESLDLSSITVIEQQALNECSNLTVFVPKTVVSIGNVAISDAKMIYCEYTQLGIPAAWHSNWNSRTTTVYDSNGLPTL